MNVEALAIVVPAHDEEVLLPACLDALAVAIAVVQQSCGALAVRTVVVLDRCTDGSAEVVARRPWVEALPVAAGSVGAARALGVTRALQHGDAAPAATWLAMTDADTRVPPGWLHAQLAHARAGADAVAGTVVVEDWEDHPAETVRRFRAAYRPVEGHRHDHGANLGCSAEAYVAVGGFAPLTTGEDVALLAALERQHRVVRSAVLPVATSARRRARAAAGFGAHLVGLAQPVGEAS